MGISMWKEQCEIERLAMSGTKEATIATALIRGIDVSNMIKREPVFGAWEDNPWGDKGPSPLEKNDLNPDPALVEKLRVLRRW